MTAHPRAVMLVRAANALFFLATTAYCLLAYIPFAYQVFLKPDVLWWIPDFLAIHAAVYWLTFLLTVLTLGPHLAGSAPNAGDEGRADRGRLIPRRALARALAVVYVATGALTGLALVVRPVMATVGNSTRSFAIALIALAFPTWLAVFDHVAVPFPEVELSDERRALVTSLGTAFCVWLAYVIGSPVRMGHVVGIDLPFSGLSLAVALSAIVHLFVFMTLFLALLAARRASSLTRFGGRLEYALLIAMAGTTMAWGIYALIFTSLAFVGVGAAIAAGSAGLTIVLVWSGMACRQASGSRRWTAQQLFLSPLGFETSAVVPALTVVLLPLIAYGLVSATSRMDWNFIVQKLGVLLVWLLALGSVNALARSVRPRRDGVAIFVVPVTAFVLFLGGDMLAARFTAVSGALDLDSVLDRYASIDLSFRLIRDGRLSQSGDTAEFYARLKANTLVAPRDVTPQEIQFARRVVPPSVRPPHVFLFVIDSLRRDYLSPYNPRVTFTPAIGRFASESFVFRRAFTRYSGTGLAVPSIWAGGMLIHMIDQRPFGGRDALLRLLDGAGYRPIMGIDSVMHDLLPGRTDIVELDRGVPSMECDFCRTTRELREKLEASGGDSRAVFSYTLPQNVHIAVASRHRVAEGRTYPGFFAPVADTVRDVDRCFGDFVEFLKRTGRYDDSVVILTADHGDSLGEEGRWGHAYFMVPEVMRVPLLIHLPPALGGRLATDLNRVTFTTDLAPTLYSLTGNAADDLGPLFGSPLFVEPGTALSRRRNESFLLASSYGAVYGMLRHNGRKLYAADAVDGRDDAYDMSDGRTARRIAITQAMLSLNRRLIGDQLDALAALNHYAVQP